MQDKLFAISFVEKEGVTLLVDAIEKSTGNNQNYALQAMLSLMQNDVPWNTFGTSLIELVIGTPVLWYSFFVCVQLVNLLVNPNSLTICRYATAILTIIVSSGPANKGVVRNYGFNVVHPCMPVSCRLIPKRNSQHISTNLPLGRTLPTPNSSSALPTTTLRRRSTRSSCSTPCSRTRRVPTTMPLFPRLTRPRAKPSLYAAVFHVQSHLLLL